MDSDPALSLPAWVVLAVIDEHPTHGFVVAALTMPGGCRPRSNTSGTSAAGPARFERTLHARFRASAVATSRFLAEITETS